MRRRLLAARLVPASAADRAIRQANPVKVVLVGDSTAAAEGGKPALDRAHLSALGAAGVWAHGG